MTTEPEAIPADVLEPCPFCGGEAKIIEGEECAYVQCVDVKMHRALWFDGDNNAAGEVAEQWNRRASRAPVDGAEAIPVAWRHRERVNEPTASWSNWLPGKAGPLAQRQAAAGYIVLEERALSATPPAPASPDAEMVRVLVDSLRHSFITSQSDGSEDEYRLVAQFKTLLELQQAYAALMDILSKHGGNHADK